MHDSLLNTHPKYTKGLAMSNPEQPIEHTNFLPTEAWPLQEGYKRELHADIQKWGDSVIPYIEEVQGQDSEMHIRFFNHLMDAVPKGDAKTATLLQTLISHTHLSARSWYTDQPFTPSDMYLAQQNRAAYKSLFAIYKAGSETTA